MGVEDGDSGGGVPQMRGEGEKYQCGHAIQDLTHIEQQFLPGGGGAEVFRNPSDSNLE